MTSFLTYNWSSKQFCVKFDTKIQQTFPMQGSVAAYLCHYSLGMGATIQFCLLQYILTGMCFSTNSQLDIWAYRSKFRSFFVKVKT